MRKPSTILRKFVGVESGATVVEYGVALLIAIIVGGIAFTDIASDVALNVQDASVQVASR